MILFFNKLMNKFRILRFKYLFRKRLSIGRKCCFLKGCHFTINENGNVNLGEGVFFNRNCSINAKGSITIGNDCIFGEDVKIYDHNHKYSKQDEKIKDQGFTVKNIKIGNNCWIGSNVIILQGVTIGNNCVIGAGVLVYKDVPDNCRVINYQDIRISNCKGD